MVPRVILGSWVQWAGSTGGRCGPDSTGGQSGSSGRNLCQWDPARPANRNNLREHDVPGNTPPELEAVEGELGEGTRNESVDWLGVNGDAGPQRFLDAGTSAAPLRGPNVA